MIMLKENSTPILHLVSPANIQSELSKIWESLEGANKTRACLFNLIFYTEKNARLDYFTKVAETVIEKFPARIIMVIADKTSSQNFLNVNVSVISAGKGESDIVCDFIQIDVAGDKIVRVPFVILPHIVPDLPVYLVWGNDITVDDPFLNQIAKLADRLIVDSESSKTLSLFSQTCLKWKNNSQVDVSDLNWARTETWRDLLSNAFYSEEKLQDLRQVSQIQITYNAAESFFFCHTTVQAIYLQTWLASQLKWIFLKVAKQNEILVFDYQYQQKKINVLLTPCQHDNFNPGMVVSLDISTAQNKHYSFYRSLDYPHQITLITSTADRCDVPYHFIFAKSELGMSLVREICHKGTSSHFLNVLQLIADIKENSSLC
jgi:glucose-6-phosphate dehydrogenase assembly protein OpcA